MKKLVSLLLALAICASLVACGGGPNKQPAIDAHNKAVNAVNELVEIINQNPEAYTDEEISFMNNMVATLDEVADALENKKDLDQDALDEWVEVCGEVEQLVNEVIAELKN